VGLRIDPTLPDGLETIVRVQQQLVLTAERLGVVALLDVPPRLRPRQVLRWRARFDSSWAAAYHPWLRIPTTSATGALVDVPPSAAAAGIIARCERRAGVPKGPANELVARAVDVRVRVDEASVAELHRSGVDAFRRGPDGIVLVGARTLSTDRQYRQLTVRRLLQLVERAVGRQLQWTVFEPNDELLRAGLTRAVEHLLRRLFDLGAFAGATPEDAWFLRVTSDVDLGQLVVEIGVAPSEPTEYVLLRLVLDEGGGVRATEAPLVGVGIHG
jgi:phage tail sheath protein FI